MYLKIMKSWTIIFQFSKKYFIFSLTLFGVETAIALYAKDRIIRPYGGDFLVVILLYCILRCFTHLSVIRTCIIVLLLSYCVETLQYFHFADKLGFQHGSIPFILLGNYFTWADMISYTLGIGAVLIIEKIFQRINPVEFF